MAADTLTQSNFTLNYPPPSPDEAGHAYYNVGYAVIPGADEIIALALSKAASSADGGFELLATGYALGGQSGVRFQKVLADVNNASFPGGVYAPSITTLANGTVAIAWQVPITDHAGNAQDSYAVLSGSGDTVAAASVAKDSLDGHFLNYQGPPDLYATTTGFNLEWNTHSAFLASNPFNPQQFGYAVQSFDLNGTAGARTTTAIDGTGTIAFAPHAFAPGAAASLQLADNAVQVYRGGALAGGATIPGEPPHAITSEAATILTGGRAAVAWVDSGTAYVSLFDPATDAFSAAAGLDWGGVQDVHLVALPDGGFVASWTNTLPPFGSPMSMPPRYEGQVFTADGAAGPLMTLAGDAAGVDSHGDLFTVSSFPTSEAIVSYAINGGGATGHTFTSDNNGDHWTGTTADDVFNLGRGGDVVSGNGGNDTYRFAEVPWAGGHITDFNAGDVLDLSGLMSTTKDIGADGFADGYLKITDDGSGAAQVWANYNLPGNDGWWLVETLDGVPPANVQHARDVVTVGSSSGGGGPTAVTTSDASYTAAANVSSITLTGSQQHVDASATNGVTINSNNTGNTLIGGPGADVFHLGRGGDVVTGGAGADTFAYSEIPWTGGTVVDFKAEQGDSVDVSGLLASAGYARPDPFADGYLKYAADSAGDAQIWANYNAPGNDGWWLVATLDGVATSSLHYAGGLIT